MCIRDSHNITNEQLKNIKYNGTGDFPIEFMKEMEDLYMEHYQNHGSVAWIGRHLEGEAAVWWRLIKKSVTNFAEFKETFTNKYWSDMIQEKVRNELEFGRYQMEEWYDHDTIPRTKIVREQTVNSTDT